ncbi:MAG: 30S ribosomal protein S8 [Microgenomates group bacterium GW2011_GWC1_37_8]|uniref:Small ribosomal subunit protein uS8 n=1 Tax=Candidatus Woesebacteria bacterium GW2011_GWB1_38_8 TaxID=1618570 RepID=A0A0G0L203_9BACT|nr:MAG: 30S ribosomal protein S8 [Microgenomates group bacterium GW2011_GWC1_37_8]KKQ86008.1 MAG: 30S ribosomal protein S8 [Candidatus Woesebacteria bacterium GW2011_GWB1_38_8]
MKKEKAKKQNTGTVNYPLGDFLIRIKNASLANKRTLDVPKSKLIKSVANALEKEGFIDEVKEDKTKISLRIVYRSKEPIISEVHLISKPGLRIYKNVEELEKIKGPFVYLISTPKGVISMQQAIKKRLGGEVLAKIL